MVDRKADTRRSKGAVERRSRATEHDADAEKEAGSTAPDRAFDRWLERGLQDLYAPVLDEPVPDDLVELIKKHRKRVS